MQSNVSSVEKYLTELPEERQVVLRKVREVVLENLPEGYEETMNRGMISYEIPLERYPDTYNKKPLMYAALAAQKNHMALYLTGIYTSEKDSKSFESKYRATGKRYDVGKSCVRFRKLEDLPLDLIGKVIAAVPVDELIRRVEKVHKKRKKRR